MSIRKKISFINYIDRKDKKSSIKYAQNTIYRHRMFIEKHIYQNHHIDFMSVIDKYSTKDFKKRINRNYFYNKLFNKMSTLDMHILKIILNYKIYKDLYEKYKKYNNIPSILLLPPTKYIILRTLLCSYCKNNPLSSISKEIMKSVLSKKLYIDIYEDTSLTNYELPYNYYKTQYINKLYEKFVYVLLNNFTEDPMKSKIYYIGKQMFNGLSENTLIVLLKYFYTYRFTYPLSFGTIQNKTRNVSYVNYWNSHEFNNTVKYLNIILTNKLFGKIIFRLLFEYCLYMKYINYDPIDQYSDNKYRILYEDLILNEWYIFYQTSDNIYYILNYALNKKII